MGRASLSDADRRAIAGALADPRFDADSLPPALDAHGLVPLAYRHLVASGDGLPRAIAMRLAAAFHRRAFSQARLALRLRELLSALEAEEIDVLPHKGPVLALQLYGAVEMRQYHDLDLLVAPGQIERAIGVLLAKQLAVEDGVGERWQGHVLRTRHAAGFRDPRTGAIVELHWRLTDRLYGPELPLDWLMQAPATIDFCGRPARAMTRERLLLALCVHGAAHQWERLSWLADVAQVIRDTPGLDWRLAAEMAARGGFTRAMSAALVLVHGLFGGEPAAAWRAAIAADEGAVRLAARIRARLSRPVTSGLTAGERFRLGWLSRESLWQRAAFTWRVVTHLSPEDLAVPDMPRFMPLAVARRAIRLLRTAAADRRRSPQS